MNTGMIDTKNCESYKNLISELLQKKLENNFLPKYEV